VEPWLQCGQDMRGFEMPTSSAVPHAHAHAVTKAAASQLPAPRTGTQAPVVAHLGVVPEQSVSAAHWRFKEAGAVARAGAGGGGHVWLWWRAVAAVWARHARV
jgi:hypothetical protein